MCLYSGTQAAVSADEEKIDNGEADVRVPKRRKLEQTFP